LKIIVFLRKILICAILISFYNDSFSQNWSQVNTGNNFNYTCVDYPNDSTIFLASFNGITKSTDGGNTWVSFPYLDNLGDTIFALEFNDMHFFDANVGFATGVLAGANIEVIYKTIDGGESWWVFSSYTSGNWPRVLNDIEFINANVGFAVGTNGRILRTTNGGSSWSVVTSNTTAELNSISFINSNVGVIVGNNISLKTTNGGTSWTSTVLSNYVLEAVHFNGGLVGYAVGNATLKSTNGGSSWAEVSTMDGNDIYATANDTAFLCYNNLMKTENQGQFWGIQSSVPVGLYKDIDFLNDLNAYVVGNNGQVFHTSNGGDNFLQLDAGVESITPTNIVVCSNPTPIFTKIKNYGVATLTSIDIHWSLNGIPQNVINWTGSLAAYATSSNITLSNIVFTGSNTELKVWTSLPNGGADQYFLNDTLTDTLTTTYLHGTYTVGGTNPDFLNLTAVNTALDNNQICGDVIFNIRDGIYNESISNTYFNTYNNGSVIFQSESGDSSAVILKYFEWHDAVNINFKKVTFVTNLQSAIVFFNTNVTVKNCVFIDSSSTISNSHFFIYGQGNNILIENCSFTSVNKAIKILPVSENVVIKKNLFNTAGGGLFIDNNINVTIQYNTFYLNSGNAISIYAKGQNEISFNKTYCDASSQTNTQFIGIAITTYTWDPNINLKIYNNYIGLNSNSTANNSGISILGGFKNLHIYNNTIQMFGGNINNACLTVKNTEVLDSTINFNVLNNIFCTNNGKAIRILNNPVSINEISNFTSNFFSNIGHNAYYGLIDKLFSVTTDNPLVSMIEWSGLFLKDSMSTFINPQLLNLYDFHIYAQSTNYHLNNAGIPVAGVNVDIEGNLRSLTPDIGADEFDPPATDIELHLSNTSTIYCAGNNSLDVYLVNHGQTAVDSVSVSWSIDGVLQPAFNVSGTLLVNDTTSLINLGNFNLGTGNHSLIVWANFNGSTIDYNSINDSINLNITASGMSGNYIIGSAPSDYLTIAAAVSDLNIQGVCGPVVFNLKPGNYNERIILSPVNTASSINTITFRSQTGDSTSVNWFYLANSLYNYVIKLDNNSSYYIFEKISIYSTSNVYCTAITIAGASNSIAVKGCKFTGFGSSNGNLIDIISGPTTDLLIENNYFAFAGRAINIAVASNQSHYGVVINKNRFLNQRENGINGLKLKNTKMNNNVFFNDSIPQNSAIVIADFSSKMEINSNKFDGNNSAIALGNDQNVYSSEVLVCNNFINLGSSLNNTINYVAFGTSNICNLYLINNTLLRQYSSQGTQLVSILGTTINTNIFNNVFASLKPNSTILNHSVNADINCDYNLYYCPQGNLFNGFNSFYERQTNSSYDHHSFEANPVFLSSTDLHLGNSYYASNNGTNAFLSAVNVDIDGQFRSNTPDIGADEFTLTTLANGDAGILNLTSQNFDCSGLQPVKVVLKNYAANNLTNAAIKWSVNGILQATFNWTGSLSNLEEDTVVIGNFNFTSPDTFEIKAWTHLPNGLVDVSNNNDTLTIAHIKTKLSGTYTVGGANPDYLTLESFTNDLYYYGICGPTTFLIRSGNYYPGLYVPRVNGSSATNTITIKSETGNPNDVVINDITITGTDFLTVRDVSVSSTQFNAMLFNDTLNNVALVNNHFAGGIRCYGCLYNNLKIDSCSIADFKQVYIDPFLNQGKGFFFTHNDAYDLTVLGSDSIIVSGNTFEIDVYIESLKYYLIAKNRIIGDFDAAIGVYNNISVNGSGIFNNEVISTNNGNGNQIGIAANNAPDAKIYHNSIKLGNNSNITYAIYPSNSSKVFNNIVSTANGKFISLSIGMTSNFASNNNVFNSNGTFSFYNYPNNYTSLSAYQNATGNDLNSLQIDPQFQSGTNLFPLNPLLLNAGTAMGIMDDIDDNYRNPNTPTIGAYELFTQPNVNLGPDTVFCGNQQLSALNPASSYLWNNGSTSQSILTAGSGYYWVTVTNSLGTATDTIYVTVKPPVSLQLSSNVDAQCANSCVTFNANATGGLPNYNYQWIPGNLVSDSTIFNPTSCQQNQLYKVVVTDQNGCKDTSSYFFETPQIPSINIAPVDTICSGEAISLNAQSNCIGCSYSWTPSQDIISPNTNITLAYPTSNTVYTVAVTANNGCVNYDSVFVTVNPVPSPVIIVQTGTGFICNTIAASYQWYYNGALVFGATNNSYNSLLPGSYFVVVANNSNCTDTSNVIIYSLTVGIDEEDQPEISIYPNPANDVLHCKIEQINFSALKIELFDIIGNSLFTRYTEPGNAIILFDVSNLANGLYFVNIKSDANNLLISKKVIINK
jgi:photosystem II stability/assembly factor-like uncharacterized protein